MGQPLGSCDSRSLPTHRVSCALNLTAKRSPVPADGVTPSPADPTVESPRLTVALAVAALSDDETQEVWEKPAYVVTWWDALPFILSLNYDDFMNLAFAYVPAITQDVLVAFVLGL